MAFFMDPGAMFLGCLGPSEQKFLVTLIETAAKSGYTRFVEPCAGTFAMANLAVQNGFKPEQIETSDVNMMSIRSWCFSTKRKQEFKKEVKKQWVRTTTEHRSVRA